VENRGRPRKEIDMTRALELRDAGTAPEIIAAEVGVSVTTVRARFKELDGTMLPGGNHVKALVSDEFDAR
jgi:hypothetical protein